MKARKEAEKKAREAEYEAKFAKEREEQTALLKKQQEEIDRRLKNITAPAASAPASAGASSLLKRAFMFLEDGDFKSADEYCERVLDADPENAEAYLGKLMAELSIAKREALKSYKTPFDENDNYKKALRFADGAFKKELDDLRLENAYNRAKSEMEAAETEAEYKEVALKFKALEKYKDSESMIDRCDEKAVRARKSAIYSSAKAALSTKKISLIEKAIKQLSSIGDDKEANELIARCNQKLQKLQEAAEQKRIKAAQKRKAEEEERKAKKRRRKIIRCFIIFGIVAAVAFIAVIVGLSIASLRNRNGIKYKLNDDGETYTVTGLNLFYLGTEELVIPDTYKDKPVTLIKDEAFEGRKKLLNVKLGNNVTGIGDEAFKKCKNLASITLGSGVTNIGKNVFTNCTGLTEINVSGENTAYKSLDGDLYTKDGKTLLQYAIGKKAASFAIPDSVTLISDYAFYKCTELTSITIPDSVTIISDYAFYQCTELTSVTIGNGVTSICAYAFNGCKKLTSITIPDSVTSISDYAFYKCTELTTVTVGSGVTSIGDYALFDGHKKVASINYRGTKEQWKTIKMGATTSSYNIKYNYTGN